MDTAKASGCTDGGAGVSLSVETAADRASIELFNLDRRGWSSLARHGRTSLARRLRSSLARPL
eukprot:395241-Pleurochrysis_carterae.AAC.1